MSIYVNARVDEDDILCELSTEQLKSELRSRRQLPHSPDISPPQAAECWQALDDAAFELRRLGKTGLAWRLDEIRHDYFSEGIPKSPELLKKVFA